MSTVAISRESMIQAGERIQQRVAQLQGHARTLFYAVMLFQRECISCGNTSLIMEKDGGCRCSACEAEFDPTTAYQTCPDCDQTLVLKTQHYWCPQCRHPVRSVFCFDERVFNSDYFREMMQESRRRKQDYVEKLRQLLLDARSPPFWPTDEPVIEDLVGLAEDLAPFVSDPIEPAAVTEWKRPRFEMDAYRQHLLDLVPGCVVDFEGISQLVRDARLDRVYRFITAVFLEHEGLLILEQSADGGITLVGA